MAALHLGETTAKLEITARDGASTFVCETTDNDDCTLKTQCLNTGCVRFYLHSGHFHTFRVIMKHLDLLCNQKNEWKYHSLQYGTLKLSNGKKYWLF